MVATSKPQASARQSISALVSISSGRAFTPGRLEHRAREAPFCGSDRAMPSRCGNWARRAAGAGNWLLRLTVEASGKASDLVDRDEVLITLAVPPQAAACRAVGQASLG